MSLTKTGPLATAPSGRTNYVIDGPKHRLWFEPHPRWIRAELAGTTVLDTVRGWLLHESNMLPRLYVPFEDLDQALLERTDHSTHCPFKGDASYWSIRVGDRVAENAVWGYEQPTDSAGWLRGFASVYPEAADAWFEEDERLLGHLRDPYHRVDARRSSRRVRVRANGEVVGETERPVLVFETGLPVRVYLPREDVRTELLEPSDKTTICPYKGIARYWSIVVDGQTIPDAVWSYEDPLVEALPAKGMLSFLGEGVEVELEQAGVVAGAAA